MAVSRVAMLSLHTSPLDQPGQGSSGGMNVYVRELAHALANMDIAVDIYTRSPGQLQVTGDGTGVRVIAVPAGPPGPVEKGAIADLAPALLDGIARLAAREQLHYDIVHSHYWSSGLIGHRLSVRWSIPQVHMFHTLSRVKTRYAGAPEDTRREIAELRLLDSADTIVAPNTVERMQIFELYGVRHAPVVVIPCGINPAPYSANAQAPRGTAGRFVVVALGRLERLKNFGLLLQAIAIACERNARFAAEVEVRIAGGPSSDEPEMLGALRDMVSTLSIEQQVCFLGAVPHGNVPALYAAADVCVIPSLHESFGLVALEAMASGVPVIATRTGGLQVTVVDGANGFLVGHDDADSLADRLLTLWSSPPLRAAFAARGMRAAQHYAWPEIADRMRCLYNSLQGEKHELADPAR